MTYNKGKGKGIAWLREHVTYHGDACLFWPLYRSPKLGYAVFGFEGKMFYAHRFMCELKHGPAPSPAHETAHTCNNGHNGCVNPKHLQWKTHKENQQDRVRAGNYSNRKGQPRYKLTDEKARQILSMKGQKTQFELAEMFGVSRCTISSIHCGRGWPHIIHQQTTRQDGS